MIFDTHAHYDDDWFDEDREEVLRGLFEKGVNPIVNVGASMEGSRASVALSERYPFVYAAVGVHPDHAPAMTEADIEELKQLAQGGRVVAIGEIGFDYGHEDELTEQERDRQRAAQKYWFERQLALAEELSLPVIIHSRGADGDTLSVMRAWAAGKKDRPGFRGGIIHCFSGSPEIAEEYQGLGFHVGVGGVLTFKNARRLPDVVASAPLSQIVLETDAPYLAPVPHRGERNDSSYLPLVVSKIAEIKGISEEEVIRVTEENAKKLFGME
ncbi:MAG: TatD family hydrolase [Lachnospiraceae bacterium]|nr:TatD family hydrolase [Lachnospiraceae bacterium]